MGEGEGAASKVVPTEATLEAALIESLQERARRLERENAMVVRASPAAAAAAAEEEARPPSLQKGTPLEKRVAKLQRVNVAVVAAQMEETARADRERMEARED